MYTINDNFCQCFINTDKTQIVSKLFQIRMFQKSNLITAAGGRTAKSYWDYPQHAIHGLAVIKKIIYAPLGTEKGTWRSTESSSTASRNLCVSTSVSRAISVFLLRARIYATGLQYVF